MNYKIEQVTIENNTLRYNEAKKTNITSNNVAIIIHLFYSDLWDEIKTYLSTLTLNYDLYVTVPDHTSTELLQTILTDAPNMSLYRTENRGRDVLPFLQVMSLLERNQYNHICKIHTKKTADSDLGRVWRKLLYFDLIGSNTVVNDIITIFDNPDIAMVTGKNTILDSERYTYGNSEKIDLLATKTGIIYDKHYLFPAGTMFWTRPEIIEPIVTLFKNNQLIFEEEDGQKDHTLAHAIERFFGIIVQSKKKIIVESPSLYSNLSDSTLNDVAQLVLSQQYVGNNVFSMQKQKIQARDERILELEELAQSLRLKNRLKSLMSDKILPIFKKISKIPSKTIAILKVIQRNPSLLKQVFYYAKKGELNYLLSKIKEKSRNNLEETNKLITLNPKEYLTNLDKAYYHLGDICIDIIIPVYNGYEFLEKLFDSVEKNTSSHYRLIVINDCSPDERIKPYLLNRLENHPTSIFIDHQKNEGFLKSVNEAYTHVSNHFLLLNTDTEVPEFWIERLMYPIIHMENIASTTPFTNSGEIASFPNFVADNDIFDNMHVIELDQVFQEVAPDKFYAAVPTGVGFCMGVNYTVTKKIGMFVEDTFGKGYGEENDWCQRAIQEGYTNLIVPNLFVYHKHGGSFSAEEKQALLKVNAIKLLDRHPNYGKDVHQYIEENPHDTLRQILVLMASDKNVGTHLIFDHDLGGGANIYANERIEQYLAEKKNILYVKYDYYSHYFKVFHYYKEYQFSFKCMSLEELQYLLDKLDLNEIFLNSLVSYKENDKLMTYIEKLLEIKKTKLIIPIHDFYPICPSYTLLNEEGKYCQVPSLETCKLCMQKNMQEWRNFYTDEVDIPKWRDKWNTLLQNCSEILCFSDASKNILLKAYPLLLKEQVTVIPHQVKALSPVTDVDQQTDSITIGILGGINYAKGAQIVKQLSQIIHRDKLNIKIVVIGEITEPIHSKNFTSTGRYSRENLPNIIKEHHINVFLIPSIWPETFSYTTQEIMMMELPLMVFNLGAPPERVSLYDKGYIIDELSADGVLQTLQKINTKS